ncbi:MAG: hypothetical protein LBI54_08295, partial [Lachnospiraceae bacterium]|nr:hypothetical protein [Lachnospiraceae bacterium]
MKKTTKRNIIIAAVILCVIVAAIFLISISFNLFRTVADQKNLTTDTWSNSFASKEEKRSFLAEYLVAPSEILDAEYHIVYHDNSTGRVPGPSDWDIRAALVIK